MKRFWIGVAAAFAVSACSGGNPFTEETDTETGGIIPEDIAGAVQGITYDPVAQTLTVRGVALDDTTGGLPQSGARRCRCSGAVAGEQPAANG